MIKDVDVMGTGLEDRVRTIQWHVREGTPVKLRRERSKSNDPNAVAVLVPVPRMFGLLGAHEECIGCLDPDAAKRLAPKIDAGTEVSGVVSAFVEPAGQGHPRVTLRLRWADS
jgi:hypothetical protein